MARFVASAGTRKKMKSPTALRRKRALYPQSKDFKRRNKSKKSER